MSKTYRPWVAAAAAAALLASLHAPRVLAETIVVGDQLQVRQTDVPRPRRGMSMAQVEKHFGTPRERHPTVGTPPITRWDYDGFAVFFEKDLVIDSVVPGPAGARAPEAPATPDSQPTATPLPAAAPAPAGAALDAAGTQAPAAPESSESPEAAAAAASPAAASAAPTAPSPAAAHAAGAAPKGADVPLSDVSLHH